MSFLALHNAMAGKRERSENSVGTPILTVTRWVTQGFHRISRKYAEAHTMSASVDVDVDVDASGACFRRLG